MFESPFKSDFDFGTEFVSSTQHPFSLRSRLREVRDAFRGFRVKLFPAATELFFTGFLNLHTMGMQENNASWLKN
ncbi:unnamed protein product [Wuchereria bancrofti]|uniref:Uncharacterized protein n=1 Tax=Wuchereria bancrofti TaxID=6293 RepID=A0A3P7DYE8_WUCBA|nr:unnamed protein product [Wuchereria bancrofti]